MKKKNQVFILFIVLFLAIVLFLYYTRKLKINEGVENKKDTEDEVYEDTQDEVYEDTQDADYEDTEDADYEDTGYEGKAVDTKDPQTSRSLTKSPENTEGQSKGNIITGEYMPISSTNPNSVSTVVQDLENDFDKAIPIINNEGKSLSRRLNALWKRVARLELLKSVQSTKTAKPT
jgi:hypothetical protein